MDIRIPAFIYEKLSKSTKKDLEMVCSEFLLDEYRLIVQSYNNYESSVLERALTVEKIKTKIGIIHSTEDYMEQIKLRKTFELEKELIELRKLKNSVDEIKKFIK